MIEQIKAFGNHVLYYAVNKIEVVMGGSFGSMMGLYLWQSNFVTYFIKLILAIIFSFLTGCAGAIGGILMKHWWENRKTKLKNKENEKRN